MLVLHGLFARGVAIDIFVCRLDIPVLRVYSGLRLQF